MSEQVRKMLEEQVQSHLENIQDLMADMDAAVFDDEIEDAERYIKELPLSVDVRSAWQQPTPELEPVEYRIVLCTGGPHVEVWGFLDMFERPANARIRGYWSGEKVSMNGQALLDFAREFTFER